MDDTNVMRKIGIGKVTLNIGAGKDPNVLSKGVKLLKSITGIDPVKTITNKRIASWGLRPGLPIGCKITIRGEEAKNLLKRLLDAKDNQLQESNFDNYGNISFGIQEYINIPDVKYDPEIGIMGLMTSITLVRPGFRIKSRKLKKAKIPPSHHISKQDSIEYFAKEYNVKLIGKEEEDEE
ncbi:MAG: 50S ribosomal protein L5 [Candidatus Woesearchaeota archaeon]